MSYNRDNFFIYADNRAIIFASQTFDGLVPPEYRDPAGQMPVRNDDIWIDLDKSCIRKFKNGIWQSAGVYGNTSVDPIADVRNAQFEITDTIDNKAIARPTLKFSYDESNIVMYKISATNDVLTISRANGDAVLTLNAAGDATFANNVTVVGDLFADDISYDEETVNLMKVNTEIQHLGNPTNRIAFDTDKINIDASGTSILLDDTAMTNQIVITGQTQFVNNIGDVPDIYLQNHIHHVGDVNTRFGFPANDQIALRTGGTDRVTVSDTTTRISNVLTLDALQPRISANMNAGTWDTRLIMQTSNSNASSKLYVLPSNTTGTAQSGSSVYSNIGDLNAAAYNLYEVGQYPTECRHWTTAASGDPLPFSWRFTGSANETMRLVRSGGANYPSDYDILVVGEGATADGGSSIAQQGIMLKARGQIQWSASPADGGPACTIFRATNSADLVLSKGWRNSDVSGTAWQSSATTTASRCAVQLGGSAILFFVNPSQTGTAGSAVGVTPQQVFSITGNQLTMSMNSATTGNYNQTLSGISPSSPILFSVPTNRSNAAVYNLTIDASAYLAGVGYYCTTVARGYIFSGALYGNSITNLSQFGLAIAVSYNSDTSLAITISDTSGVASSKVGTVSVRLTVSN